MILSLILIPLASAGLYGIFEPTQLYNIDPTTATKTPIGSPLSSHAALGLSALDSDKRIFYFIGYSSSLRYAQVVGVSVDDGSTTTQSQLPFLAENLGKDVQSLDYESKSGLLIVSGVLPKTATTENSTTRSGASDRVVISIKPGDKTYTKITTLSVEANAAAPATVVDSASSSVLLQYQADDSKGGVALATFVVKLDDKSSEKLDFTYQMQTMAMNGEDNLVYGVGQQNTSLTSLRLVLSYDIVARKEQKLGSLVDYQSVFAQISTVDSTERALYLYMQKRGGNDLYLLTIALDTAKVKSSVKVSSTIKDLPRSIEFIDPRSVKNLLEI